MKNRWVQILIPALLFTAGVTMLVIGIVRGEAFSVFQKAVRICLECIGIG